MHGTLKNVGLGKLWTISGISEAFVMVLERDFSFSRDILCLKTRNVSSNWAKGSRSLVFFFKSLVFRFHGHNSSNWARIEDHRRQCRATPWARGGTPLYKPYRYVPPQRAGLLGLFGLKTCLHFTHFGLESGMVFEGTTEAYERIYRSKCKWIRKK